MNPFTTPHTDFLYWICVCTENMVWSSTVLEGEEKGI